MDINLIFKLAGMAIIITILYTLLKQAGRDDFAFSILLLGLVLALMIVIEKIGNLFDMIQSVFGRY